MGASWLAPTKRVLRGVPGRGWWVRVSELLAAPSRARRARMSEAWMRSKLRPNTSDNERLMLPPHAGDQQQTPPSEFDPGLEAARFFSLDGQVAKTHEIR